MELKATDLRIGNWVVLVKENIYENKDYQLDAYDIYKASEFDDITECLLPIPLTEEWLIKFGFEKINERTFRIIDKSKDEKLGYKDERNWKELDIIYWEYIAMGSYAKGYKFKWNDEKYVNYQKEKTIDYVHQLQNLYFALTGEELTIKE
jgi:hypothetical protein